MGLLSDLAALFVPDTQARHQFPDLQSQISAIRRTPNAFHPPSITEALSVPAIFRAVTLISNTVGSLAMEGYRQGQRLRQEDSPRLIVRPNPFTTPREFYRDTSYAMASRGEAWWWIARRDISGAPTALYPVPPQELQVTPNDRDRLRPLIEWGQKRMPNEDMVQVVLTREPGSLRGSGPLQMCGAAVTVSVEAQQFAANFFIGGGWPSAVIKSALDLTEDEALALKDQWTSTPNNMPKVIDPGIESVETVGTNPSNWQLTEQRTQQNGEAARMFGIPGALLEYNASGSSLTYQNVTEVYTQFVRTCLAPNYLEPIEQAMSDLLDGRTVSRFNVDGLLRADVKTRYEVHELAINTGVYGPDYAQRQEGIIPGSSEVAPVPFSEPLSAIEGSASMYALSARSLSDLRCPNCGRLNGRAAGYAEVACKRCGTMVTNVA